MEKLLPVLFVVSIACISCKSEERKEASDIPEYAQSLDNLSIYSTIPEPAYEIILEQDVSFGNREVFFGSIISDVESDEIGRVYIADAHTKTIHIYDPKGSHLRSIGREGSGPGEFRMIRAIELTDRHLLALDPEQFKISKYDLNTFEFVRDIDISLYDAREQQPSWVDWTQDEGLFYRPINFFVNPDDNYLLIFGDQTVGALDNLEGRTWEISVFSPSEERYLAHDVLSLRADMNSFTFDDGSRISQVPFKPEAHLDSNDEQMVYGWGNDLLFKWYNTSGDYQQSFYYSRQNVAVKLDEIIAYYERDLANHEELRDHFLRGFRNSDLPDQWPAFHHLKLDDENRIWIAVVLEDIEVHEWWVLEKTGELITRFEWPRDEPIEVVRNGYLYTRETSEMDEISIVRYRIELNPKD